MLIEKIPSTNREGNHAYDITWPWERTELDQGVTVVMRVKNEAQSLPHVLRSLAPVGFHEVVLVDNGSTDQTREIASTFDGVRILDYPHQISRCGPEHLDTPADSIHSLPYFYNWAFAQVNTNYALKWDGDMVLTPKGQRQLLTLRETLPARKRARVLQVPRHPLYLKDENEGWLDLGWRNREAFGWPVSPETAHVKGFDWEVPMWAENAKTITLRQGSCLELKWLSQDEFAHWTAPDHFSDARSKRKQREWHIHGALSAGRTPQVAGLVHLVAPTVMDVITYASEVWLPNAPSPLTPNAVKNFPVGRNDEEGQ